MKKWNCSVTSILMFALLFLMMPQKSATAQKLISETLQSKTLVEEDDGFKWYRYTYEYQVKFKGNKINFTRESAYNTKGRVLIDGRFNVDWIKQDCEYANFVKKEYKKYPSKIKDEYALILEYNPSYGLFVAKNGNGVLGTFSETGECYTGGGEFGENGIVIGLGTYEMSHLYAGGRRRWIRGKEKYHDCGVVKNGKIVIPFKYEQMKIENGLYFCGRYANNGEKYEYYADVFSPDGVLIGSVGEKYGKDELAKEFFDGPNGEKWLKYGNNTYSENNGFYYCITSGKKIDWGYNDYYYIGKHENLGRYMKIDGNLYTGAGEQITNYGQKTSYTYLFNDGSADLFVVEKGGDYKQKGLIKIEGNQAKEMIACEYDEISCLNADDGGDLFLVSRPYNGDSYRDGVIKVEGNQSKEVLSCNYFYHWSYEAIGRYIFWKSLDEVYTVVVDNHGNTIVPLSKYYFHLSFSEEKNVFQGRKQSGNTVYEVALDLNGKEISCKKSYDITPKSSTTTTTTTTQQPKQETVTPTSTSTSSSSSSTSSTTNGSGNDKGLLYKGEYTICRSRQYDELTGNPMGISASDETQVVEIYEDHVYLGVHYCEYQSTNNRGERVYKDNLNKDATLYVSPNFDIRYYWSMTSMYGSCNVVIPVEKGTSYMSGGNGGYSAPQQSGYNGGNIGGNAGGNSGSNTSTSSKTHKCSLCNGTGRVIENNGTSFGNTKYCSECGKTVPDYHYHTTCPSCNGKGYW